MFVEFVLQFPGLHLKQSEPELIFQRKPRAVPPQIRDRQSCQKRTFTQNGGSAILGKTELGDSRRVCNILANLPFRYKEVARR